jgi:hypothetical protein
VSASDVATPRVAERPRSGGGAKTRMRRALAIAIALMLALAGGLGGYFAIEHKRASEAVVVDDGPTFYEALSAVNTTVTATTGGPWVLFQVYGIAAPGPSSPGVWGWLPPLDSTLQSCQAAFNGVTLWNGTLPLFNGTFNSGTAPFWQIVFFSNASQQILVATDVLGTPHVYPPVAMSSPCAVHSGLGIQPWVSAWTFYKWAFPRDTPAMAAGAWNAVARKWVAWLGKVPTEMYFLGADQFGSGQPVGTQTDFFTCGTVGGAGITRGLDAFADTYNTANVSMSDNYTLGCTPTSNNWTALPVEVNLTNATVSTHAHTEVALQQLLLQVSNPYGDDPAGITSWMVGLSLTDGNGQPLQLASSGCSAWVASIADCPANSSGWYAVLLSGGGGWQGSFGAIPSGSGWNYPVIPIVTDESLAIVVPSTWNVSGDVLSVSSTTSELPLNGTSVLK